jgi:hypothetical protein
MDYDGDSYGDSSTTQYSCDKPSGSWVNNGDDLDDRNRSITDVREQYYYLDYDRDGYGDPNVSTYTSNPPPSYVTDSSDCDDSDSCAYPGAIWYYDGDGDGYGDLSRTRRQCLRPANYVCNSSDLNDNDKFITNVSPRRFYEDKDRDTYGNPSVNVYRSYPPSTGNWVTNANDCNDTDASLHNFTLWALDQDGDGFGYNATFLAQTNSDRATPGAHAPPAGVSPLVYGCTDPSTPSYAYVKNNRTDYDDTLTEISNIKPQWFYLDQDQDSFGTHSSTLFQSDKPSGYTPFDGDCDDHNPLLHPQTVWYEDADGDTFGNVSSTLVQCEMPPTGYVSNALDFSDTTTHVTNIQPEYFYRDQDGDQYGNPAQFVYYSYLPQGYVRNNLDCDDSRAEVNPDTLWYRDADGDSYGTSSDTLAQCTQPLGYVTNKADYDDNTVHIINIPPRYFYHDFDGDRYGDPEDFVYYSLLPPNYVTNNLDCDDTDPSINPQKIWYRDSDGDGLGTHTVTTTSCLQPEGYVDNFEDLGDETKYITNVAPVPFYFDADGDGYGDPHTAENYSFAPPNYYPTGEDCNDSDARIHPLTVWYYDKDGDGFGDDTISFIGCIPPPEYVLKRGDLDSNNPLITDVPGRFYYRDKDGDGYGVDQDTRFQSHAPEGYASLNGDCDDYDASLHPDTVWYHDRDQDGFGGELAYKGCTPRGTVVRNHADWDDTTDRITDVAPRTFYEDRDDDGDGNPQESYRASYPPNGYVPNRLDCDDTNPLLHHRTAWFLDADGDGFGDPNRSVVQCQKPSDRYQLNGWDYDDSTDLITNIPPQDFYPDLDGDGYGPDDKKVRASHPPVDYVSDGGDCDDTDSLLHPETHWFLDADGDGFGGDTLLIQCKQPENYVLNSDDWDNNEPCITDLTPRDFYADNDNDGYGDPTTRVQCSFLPEEHYVINGEDCDDTDDGIKPTTVWYRDADGDGYGTEEETLIQCEPPEGFSYRKGDCDDQNPYLLPSALRVVTALGLDPGTQSLYRDCLAPEPEELTEEERNEERLFYADRDFDGFGDPEEEILPDAIALEETLNYAVVLNGEDACPKVYGEFKGCPKPFVLKTELGALNNQEVRLFEEPTEASEEDQAKELDDELIANIQTFPNPTTGLLTALWEADIAGLVEEIRVLGYQNNIEFSIPFSTTENSATIDLSSRPADIYFVQFYLADGRRITKKIIKTNP